MASILDNYRVVATDNPQIPYELHGSRGAHYGLMRVEPNPTQLFAINMRSFGCVDRLGWFTDRNGKLEAIRR
jgi:hypothetical protein